MIICSDFKGKPNTVGWLIRGTLHVWRQEIKLHDPVSECLISASSAVQTRPKSPDVYTQPECPVCSKEMFRPHKNGSADKQQLFTPAVKYTSPITVVLVNVTGRQTSTSC